MEAILDIGALLLVVALVVVTRAWFVDWILGDSEDRFDLPDERK